jgi:UDP-N-acetylglucosamine--N-acetylmuramyl-(pentapeptide) pyrophosphoryl-undecaprenol N-acetylglucosamine transferase
MDAKEPTRLHLVASSGGHLELLAAVSPALSGHELVWVTPDSERARALEAAGGRLETIPFYGRNVLRLVRHLCRVVPLVLRERPRLVVTTGAGPTVPFCLLTRLLRGKVVFIETMARVTDSSISGRILSRIASAAMVQWPEMLEVYRGAHLCRPALLSDVRPRPARDGEGTFVALGTHVQGFDRLLGAVDTAVGSGLLPGPAHGQSGTSAYRAEHVRLEPYMTPEAIDDAMRRARYIVCHAGSGIISSSLRAGHRPIVMARLHAHGEHVDDHQTQIVQKLAGVGLVVPIDGELTPEHLAAADEPLDPAALDEGHNGALTITATLVERLEALDGRSGRDRRWTIRRKSARRHAVDQA